MLREIHKKYTKNRENNKPGHKFINTMIVSVVIGNPVLMEIKRFDHNTKVKISKRSRISKVFHNCTLNK